MATNSLCACPKLHNSKNISSAYMHGSADFIRSFVSYSDPMVRGLVLERLQGVEALRCSLSIYSSVLFNLTVYSYEATDDGPAEDRAVMYNTKWKETSSDHNMFTCRLCRFPYCIFVQFQYTSPMHCFSALQTCVMPAAANPPIVLRITLINS